MSSHSSTINTEFTNDLKFLILEVKKMLEITYASLKDFDEEHIKEVDQQEAYVENLKVKIEALSYEAIARLGHDDKDAILHYRSLIRVASNVKRVAEFSAQITRQTKYIKEKKKFPFETFNQFFEIIFKRIETVHIAFTEVDVVLAEALCKSEQRIDNLYLKEFKEIQILLAEKTNTSDLLTQLFMLRYLERIGDSFLKIGESVLNISVGDAVNIRHYQNLKEVVVDLSHSNSDVEYQFKPFLFSRSGCKVGRLTIEDKSKVKSTQYLYKEGNSKKIKEELKGLEFWKSLEPKYVTDVVWKSKGKKNSTLVVEYLHGDNVMNLILGCKKLSEVKQITDALIKALTELWEGHMQKGTFTSYFIPQIQKRKSAIEIVHPKLFTSFYSSAHKKRIKVKSALKKAAAIEQTIKLPFKVFCHGDFNLDNIIYNRETDKIYFIDVHRSSFSDYAQEISVFIVSLLRIQIENKQAKRNMLYICTHLFQFANEFAQKHQDEYFQARFAFGLFRSMLTSTRFVADSKHFEKLRNDAFSIYDQIVLRQDDLTNFKFSLETLLSHYE